MHPVHLKDHHHPESETSSHPYSPEYTFLDVTTINFRKKRSRYIRLSNVLATSYNVVTLISNALQYVTWSYGRNKRGIQEIIEGIQGDYS